MAVSLSVFRAIKIVHDNVSELMSNTMGNYHTFKEVEKTRELMSVVFPGQEFKIVIEKGVYRITIPDELAQKLLETAE